VVSSVLIYLFFLLFVGGRDGDIMAEYPCGRSSYWGRQGRISMA